MLNTYSWACQDWMSSRSVLQAFTEWLIVIVMSFNCSIRMNWMVLRCLFHQEILKVKVFSKHKYLDESIIGASEKNVSGEDCALNIV